MKTSYTPGPWIVDPDLMYAAVRIKEFKKGKYRIATVGTMGARKAEDFANAALIAAAPELLEALQGFMAGAEAMGWNTDKARAAIAKAGGVL